MSKRLIFAAVVGLSALTFFAGWKVFSEDYSSAQITHAGTAAAGQSGQNRPAPGHDTQQLPLPGGELGAPQSMIGIRGVGAFLLDEIAPGSPAEQAGLKPGDLVTWVDGNAVASLSDVLQISRRPSGQRVELFVLRYNPTTQQRDPLTVTLTTVPWKPPTK